MFGLLVVVVAAEALTRPGPITPSVHVINRPWCMNLASIIKNKSITTIVGNKKLRSTNRGCDYSSRSPVKPPCDEQNSRSYMVMAVKINKRKIAQAVNAMLTA